MLYTFIYVYIDFFFPTGQRAFTIEATDNENDPLSYSFREPSPYFRVNGNTGEVFVETDLNREVQCRGGTVHYIYSCYAVFVCVFYCFPKFLSQLSIFHYRLANLCHFEFLSRMDPIK